MPYLGMSHFSQQSLHGLLVLNFFLPVIADLLCSKTCCFIDLILNTLAIFFNK